MLPANTIHLVFVVIYLPDGVPDIGWTVSAAS